MHDTHRATKPFWHGPDLIQPGDTLTLTPAQAQYMGDEIEPLDTSSPDPVANPVPEPKPRRRPRDGATEAAQ